VPDSGVEPPHNHEEGTLQEAKAITAGRLGAALSRSVGVLALSRLVELKQYNAVLREIISGFERLKKGNNERLKDLKWLRDQFERTGPGFQEQ
jgi:hypothetical protein